MLLRYSYRLDPSPGQRQALARAFGCARVVFNDALAARRASREEGRPFVTDVELSKWLTQATKDPERSWLSEVSIVVLQQALRDLNAAYRKFLKSLKGELKGPRIGPPRFRSRKDSRQSIRFTRAARFAILPNGKLRLPKIGNVTVRWSRELPCAPSSVTVIRDAAVRYFASFVVDINPRPLPATEAECGIDLGLDHFVVLDDGRKVRAPRFLRRAEKKLRRLDQSGEAKRLSRRRKPRGNPGRSQ